ncbi:magnesium/cobalt transporter CorA [Paenibacillus sambharensis]|uniref:magnesium/cobalt transporter CorA n=1 Tax=Paenibacillus sambharensis TaxID=1803190 RepID=UPI001FEB5CB6|nr:magnesium/cobalt transporter CorA [Paenibacillus sambharensis]
MLRITGFHAGREPALLERVEELQSHTFDWVWVDFDRPSAEETELLDTYFKFHPLAIEDCGHELQRPKWDQYEDMHFFVLHALQPETLQVEEVNLFVADRLVVTYHLQPSRAVEEAWRKLVNQPKHQRRGPLFAAYIVMDKLVDYYFPVVYELEDQLAELDDLDRRDSGKQLMEEVFAIRSRLLKLRKTMVPMRELLYRIINTERIPGIKEHRAFFTDVHDHLLRLNEMIDSSRELTADIRDSYLSYNSDRMNTIMKTLTVITTIFMPLTFIAGLYGMNFANMPELEWRWGYFAVLAVMALLGSGMFVWFRRKGWFR